jgi:hypothetical protein
MSTIVANSNKTTNEEQVFDDELDENFEEDVVKNNTSKTLKPIVESFDNPKGLEDCVNDMPMFNDDTMKKYIQSMPREKLEQLYKSMMAGGGMDALQKEKIPKDFGKQDFASVADDHRLSVRDKLRKRLEEKQVKRKALNPQEKAMQKNNKNQIRKPKNNDLVKKMEIII